MPTRDDALRVVPAQHGRRFVVTGASGGIGLETARVLAERGAEVVLAVRNLDRGRAAARQVGAGAVVEELDVSDLGSVRRFADRVGAVDVLVNNAGVLGLPRSRSVDGFELQLATNHLGHFALANLLLARLTDRVVVVGSQSHRSGDLDLDDLDWSRRGYQPYAAYAASKLANLVFLGELQRRLTAARSTLRATGAHPGTSATGVTGNTGNRVLSAVGAFGIRLVGMAPWQGALPIIYAATLDLPGNTYLGPHRFRELNGWPTGVGRSPAAVDAALGRRLWEVSESLTSHTFPL